MGSIIPLDSTSLIGIDVSKDRLDVHPRPSGEAFAVARNGEGLDQLIARLAGVAPARAAPLDSTSSL